MRFVFWWDIPCKGIAGVIREFSKLPNVSVLVVTGNLSASRKNMGWSTETFYPAEHIVLDDHRWIDDSSSVLSKYFDYYHIFNGYYHPKRISKVINKAISLGILFSIFSESPSNPYSGLKYYLAEFYYNHILFWRSRKFVSKADFIFCLSGSDSREIHKLIKIGWDKNKVIPFGYFTDIDSKENSIFQNEIINLFCPGNLVPHKGVDILIKALNLVKNINTSFHCHITGDGSERYHLEFLVKKYDLLDFVTFHGVLSQNSYDLLQEKMDILIAPGRIEPWGIRINEAIQKGQAVIVSDQIGAKELVYSSKGGAVFKSGDINELSKFILHFVSNKENLLLAKKNNLEYRFKISPLNVSKYIYNILVSKKIQGKIFPNWL